LQILETRLDNLVFQAGLGATRSAARQFVNHGHVKVNGRKVDVPSYSVRIQDVVEVRDHAKSRQMAVKSLEASTSRAVPDWVSLDREHMKATLLRVPSRAEIQPIANEQAVVEFYSR
jgi:small subunit ribosomal protein S4